MAGEVFAKLFPEIYRFETLKFFLYCNKLLSSILMVATPPQSVVVIDPRQNPKLEIIIVTESNLKKLVNNIF